MPECTKCGEPYSEERKKLGYDTCLKCGETRKPRTFGVAYNKGPLMLITPKYIKDMGKK